MITTRIKYSFYEHFQYRTYGTCQNESSEIFLTIAVISSYERLLIYLPSMFNTWVLRATIEIEIIVFIEEKSSTTKVTIEELFLKLNQNIKACLFIVKLKNVENSYPPQKKSFYAMKFIYAFYRHRTSWLLRLDDNAYVNIEELGKWLKSIDSKKNLYIGQGGSGRRNGVPIHFPSGKYFCMGGSGVILSRSTLAKLGPWLDHCFHNETLTPHEDVELGRCILKHVHIGCSRAYNAKSLFYHHYGPRYSFGHDFTSSIISQALIMHPIKDQYTFRQIYAFYLRAKQEQKYVKTNASLNALRYRKNDATFLSELEFDLSQHVLSRKIDPRWRFYIEQTVGSYIEKTRMSSYRSSSKWILTQGKFTFGYHHVTSTHGIGILVEVQLNVYLDSKSSNRLATTQKRFHIHQTFAKNNRFEYREIKFDTELNENLNQLNIIVVSSNKDEALLRFTNNFESEVINDSTRHKHFTLTILYFSQNTRANNRTIEFIHQLSVRYPSIIRISIIDNNKTSYNRGLGRQLASKLFTNNQLLFFLDVDLIFTGQALDSTRRLMIHQLSISSCTVYFPIIFSFFSNMFVTRHNPTIDINSRSGLFSIYGFGNVAVRKEDLDKIGGWETNNRDWGLEDGNLYHRFNDPTSDCYVFRAVEPGLRHYYHKKMCNGIMNKAREKMCIEADAMLIGSHADMTNYLMNTKTLKS
ncbi:unnamed protein product [Rotaria socialis]|uniref:Hexosyltransferase n=2 Tax=Rotaria socialis TaxID=392032 RepID=A0A818RTI7_9BILA|nr:unnamed protein product [Rotaria socialis]CAF3226337.1 unnamed protein product [Rotaria socialis]CAF3662118.1 unnamed protein product [Rotaria socialis]CAF3767689.1 unnamed protein product [Rotaria socialis]CAF4127404.1 unnamed protein product [Rotaria socialis]